MCAEKDGFCGESFGGLVSKTTHRTGSFEQDKTCLILEVHILSSWLSKVLGCCHCSLLFVL